MLTPTSLFLTMMVATSLVTVSPRVSSAQVPDAGSVPRLAVPTREAVVVQPTAAPLPAPVTQAAPAPEVTAVGSPTGVTTVGTAAPAPTSSTSQAATAVVSRSYVAGRFALVVEGTPGGFLRSAEGGAATSEVVVERVGADGIAAKHLAGVTYELITVATGLQSRALTDWIAASWTSGPQRKNGAVQHADYDNTVVSEREFVNALIAETTLPALDAASKDAASITVKLAPEATRLKPGSGAKAQGSADKSQGTWSRSGFRFEMTGLDGGKVSKIDSFTVRLANTATDVGEARDYEKAPGHIEFPNLRITLAATSAQTWEAWHEDFVLKGNNGPAQERSGAIVYLDAVTGSELGRIKLSGCGIYRLAPERAVTGAEAIARVVAELYCERMELVRTGK